jgi:hypothetical protein
MMHAVDGSGSFRKLSSITRLFFYSTAYDCIVVIIFKVVKIDACY